jgi:DtxR family Mn-dependent transcriptional regulator
MPMVPVEDVLKTLYRLHGEQTPVTVTGLAEQLQQPQADTENTLDEMAGQDLVTRSQPDGVRLTEHGRQQALEWLLSQAMEDYLKTIFKLQREGERVTTSAIADRLRIKDASVTGMIKKLAELKLVEHERYQGVKLTPAGEKIALEVIRHHRLLESYLADALGYRWDEVDAEAERLEHVISEDFESRIAALLGHPNTDPHGDPIPSQDLVMPPFVGQRLSDLPMGHTARVVRVADDDPALLRYLSEIGLVPQVIFVLRERAPFNGPLVLEIGGRQIAIGLEVADKISVVEDRISSEVNSVPSLLAHDPGLSE